MLLCRQCSLAATLFCCSGWMFCSAYALGTVLPFLRSDDLAHKLYAAADAFLMPSRFEPCGLTQLISFRYGTVPIVRETGGLRDTVAPINEYDNTGEGFSFTNYNADEMLGIINYSKHIYFDQIGRAHV